MTIARPMRMTPPSRFPEASSQVARSGWPARRIYVRWRIPHLPTILCTSDGYLEILKSAATISRDLVRKYSRLHAEECSLLVRCKVTDNLHHAVQWRWHCHCCRPGY